MPIYEYRRPDGTTFEVLQKFSDEALTHDPETGVPVERVFRPPAIHFKGKGFHNTDYGTRKRNREKEGSSSEDGGGASKDSSPSESTPAASSDGSKTPSSSSD